MKATIGFIGLGKMGNPMSKNLLKAGYAMVVCDIDPSAREAFSGENVKIFEVCRETAAQADIIISSIPDDSAMEAVVFGDQGIFQDTRPGSVYIDMSTVSPRISARVEEMARAREIDYLRAPVSGSTESAKAGILTIMVSGPQSAYERCEEIFQVLGQKVFYVGSGDQARYLKLLINIMVGITSAITAEALVFGKRGGLDWHQTIDIINNSVIASPLLGFKAEMLKKRDFAPAFTVAQMMKDFDLTLDAAKTLDVPLPLTSMTRQLYAIMKATDRGEFDYFGLQALLEEMAGIRT